MQLQLVLASLPLQAAAFSWNWNWLRQTNLGHADSRENKRPESRIEPMARVFELLNSIPNAAGPCDACKHTLSVMKDVLAEDRSALGAVFYGICSQRAPQNALFARLCADGANYRAEPEDGGFSFLPDFANALGELDPFSIDGDYLCHYMFSNACPRPPTPEFDYTQLWPPPPPPEAVDTAHHVRSGETLRVLHVSDVHLSANYTQHSPANCLGAMCCEEVSFQNPLEARLAAPKFGHWRCDCPQQLLESSVAAAALPAADGGPRATFALFTGDMVDHNPVFISQEETFREEALTMRALKRFLGDIPVFPVLGNHDSYPYSQEAAASSPYANRTQLNLELMQHMWSQFGWLDGLAAQQVRTTHGGYAIEPVPGLKVITLNSNYWYRWNFYNYINMEDPDPSGMLHFLIAELLDCEQRGIRAWVQAHVPPGGLADEALPPAAALFTAALERFAATISGQFFGHTHLDEFSVLYSSASGSVDRHEDAALNVAWIAPSITPYTDLNPGWRTYDVDTRTFEIMDAHTHFADIEPTFGVPWENVPDLRWRELYSTRKRYAARVGWPAHEPLDGRFWHRVADEFLYTPDFAKEFVKLSYRESSRAPECTDYECRAERYCYATSMNPDQVVRCHDELRAGARVKADSGAPRRTFGHRVHPSDGGRAHLRGGVAFHGFPTFPMPRAPRFFDIFT